MGAIEDYIETLEELDRQSPHGMTKELIDVHREIAARLNKLTERVGALSEHIGILDLITKPKPSPDKQEMFSKQETIEAYAERLVAWYAFPEPDELRQILSDFYEEVKHGA